MLCSSYLLFFCHILMKTSSEQVTIATAVSYPAGVRYLNILLSSTGTFLGRIHTHLFSKEFVYGFHIWIKTEHQITLLSDKRILS